MTSKTTEPQLIRSELCQDRVVDGELFEISIVSTDQNPEWCLEVIDKHGMSHVWGATFDTDAEALEAATIAFSDEGAAGFLQTDTNVVPFPSGTSDKGAGG
jgi:hypothetical protein